MSDTLVKKETETYLDILRGMAILFVIALHAMSYFLQNSANYGSYSWYIFLVLNSIVRAGVPIFFMMSGYLHLKSDLASNTMLFYRKRLPHIVVPLLVWNLLYYLFPCFLNYEIFSLKQCIDEILELGTYYHLWYLYTLIGIYLMTPFLKK